MAVCGGNATACGRVSRSPHQLPIDAVKIDRSLVQAVASDRLAREIVQTMLRLGRALTKLVIPEGIATPEVAQHLSSIECDWGQGLHLAAPLPAEMVVAFFEERVAAQGVPRGGD